MIPDIKLPPNWRQNEDHFTVTEEEYGGSQHAFNNQDNQAMYALPGSQGWISLMSSLRASIYVEEGFDQTGPSLLHWSLKEVVMAYPDKRVIQLARKTVYTKQNNASSQVPAIRVGFTRGRPRNCAQLPGWKKWLSSEYGKFWKAARSCLYGAFSAQESQHVTDDIVETDTNPKSRHLSFLCVYVLDGSKYTVLSVVAFELQRREESPDNDEFDSFHLKWLGTCPTRTAHVFHNQKKTNNDDTFRRKGLSTLLLSLLQESAARGPLGDRKPRMPMFALVNRQSSDSAVVAFYRRNGFVYPDGTENNEELQEMKCTMSIYVANPPRLLDTSWPDFESLTCRHMLELRLHTPEEHLSVEGLDTPSKSHLPHRVALQTFLMSFDRISDEGRGATTSKGLVDGQSSNENSQTTHANQHTLQLIMNEWGHFYDQGSGEENADCLFELLRHQYFNMFEKGLHLRWVFASLFFALGRLTLKHPFYHLFTDEISFWSNVMNQAKEFLHVEDTFKVTPSMFSAYGKLLHNPSTHCGDIEQSILFQLCDLDLCTFSAQTNHPKTQDLVQRQWDFSLNIQNLVDETRVSKRSAYTVDFRRKTPLLLRGYVDHQHYISFAFSETVLARSQRYLNSRYYSPNNESFVPRHGDVDHCASGSYCDQEAPITPTTNMRRCACCELNAHEGCTFLVPNGDYKAGAYLCFPCLKRESDTSLESKADGWKGGKPTLKRYNSQWSTLTQVRVGCPRFCCSGSFCSMKDKGSAENSYLTCRVCSGTVHTGCITEAEDCSSFTCKQCHNWLLDTFPLGAEEPTAETQQEELSQHLELESSASPPKAAETQQEEPKELALDKETDEKKTPFSPGSQQTTKPPIHDDESTSTMEESPYDELREGSVFQRKKESTGELVEGVASFLDMEWCASGIHCCSNREATNDNSPVCILCGLGVHRVCGGHRPMGPTCFTCQERLSLRGDNEMIEYRDSANFTPVSGSCPKIKTKLPLCTTHGCSALLYCAVPDLGVDGRYACSICRRAVHLDCCVPIPERENDDGILAAECPHACYGCIVNAGKCCAGQDCNFNWENIDHHVTYPTERYKCFSCEKVMHKWCGYMAPDELDTNVVKCYCIPCKRGIILRQAEKKEYLQFEQTRLAKAKHTKVLAKSELKEYYAKSPACENPGADQLGHGINFEKSVIEVMLTMLRNNPKFLRMRKQIKSSWASYHIANGKHEHWLGKALAMPSVKGFDTELQKRQDELLRRKNFLQRTAKELEDIQRLHMESKTKPPSDVAYGAVIHQHEGIQSLLWSTTRSATDEPDVDLKKKKFFARISPIGCNVLGLRQSTIEVTEDWVNLHFDANFVATVKATVGTYVIASGIRYIQKVALADENDEVWTKGKEMKYIIDSWQFIFSKRKRNDDLPGGHFTIWVYPEKTKITPGSENRVAREKKNLSIDRVHETYGYEFARKFRATKGSARFECAQGIKPVPGTPEALFVEDTRKQIMSVRVEINPSTKKKSYTGLICSGKVSYCPKHVKLKTAWVEKNFEEDYLDEILATALSKEGGNRRFVPVVVGASREDPEPPFVIHDLPNMHYHQEEQQTCLISSLCSALHWLGLEDKAEQVFKEGLKHVNAPDQPKKISVMMGRHLASLMSLKVRKGNDILNPSNWTIYPRMVVLCAKDGGCEHGVTICGGLLFDSTYKTALPLTRENLDWSCINGYECVNRGYDFKEPNEKKKKSIMVPLEKSIFHEVEYTVSPGSGSGSNVTTTTTLCVTPVKKK